MNEKLKEKVKESLSSVLPITLIVLVLSVTLVPMEIGTLALFLTGAVLLIVGMGFFQLGAEMSMTPLGEGVGKTLAKREKVLLIVLVAFALGTIITIAEPDLQVLANQVASIPNSVLIWTVAVGVGVFLALAVLRILFRVSLAKFLLGAYALLFVLTLFSPKEFLAVAFDAGGVTTGPITVPFIMALGVGVSAIRSTQGHDDDSFGLVALCSIGPILMVLLLGIFYHPTDAAYSAVEIAPVITTRDVAQQFALGFPGYAEEVLLHPADRGGVRTVPAADALLPAAAAAAHGRRLPVHDHRPDPVSDRCERRLHARGQSARFGSGRQRVPLGARPDRYAHRLLHR